MRIIKDKQPLFFLAENVSGMLHKKHQVALNNIISTFEEAGYKMIGNAVPVNFSYALAQAIYT